MLCQHFRILCISNERIFPYEFSLFVIICTCNINEKNILHSANLFVMAGLLVNIYENQCLLGNPYHKICFIYYESKSYIYCKIWTPKEKIPHFQWINIPRASYIGYWTSSFIKRNTYQKNKVIRSLPILLLMHHDKYLQKYLLEILLCRDQSLWNRNFKQAECVSLKPPELGCSKIYNKHPDYVIRHTGTQLDLASTQLCLLWSHTGNTLFIWRCLVKRYNFSPYSKHMINMFIICQIL